MSDFKQSANAGGIGTTVLLVIALIVVIILLGGFLFNYTRIDQLTRALQDTQKQVQNVQQEREMAKNNLQEQAIESAQDIAGAIKDVKNPAIRLALTKAYAARLRTLLTTQEQEDLDTIVVYVEKNPGTLFQDNPNLPSNVALAIKNLQAKLTTARNNSVATVQEIDDATYSPNEVVTLTGTIEYVDDDEILGGSIFTLKDTETGNVFYLHFNEANSENIQENMVGQEVTLNVKVTSKANEPLTFQVISGPTLVAGVQLSPTPVVTQ